MQTLKKLPAVFFIFSITAGAAFLVYWLTLEPDLSWVNFGGDGGELITAAVSLGIPHPPGYPTYVIFGNLFGRLPVGTIAFRFNLMSAVGAAGAAGFVAAAVYRLLVLSKSNPDENPGTVVMAAAVSTGLTFAFGSLVWSQAIIAEVYGLNLVFAAGFVYCLIRQKNLQVEANYLLIGLLAGISITFHLTSFFLLPLAFFLIPKKGWLRLGIGILAGLIPFLLLPLLTQSESPVIWGRVDTLEGWWWLVSAQIYRPNVFGLPSTEWPNRLSEWGRLILEQFAYIGWPVLMVGIFGRIKTIPGLIPGLIITASLYGVYAFTYQTIDAVVLLLPALLLLSIILGFGLQKFGRASLILPLALLWLNLGQSEYGYYINAADPVRPAAENLLESVPADSVLLTPGDPTIAALWYFHHIEGIRPDIIIVDGNQFQFDWYREQLGRDYPSLEHLAQDDLPGFIQVNRQKRPLCEVSLVSPGYVRC